jgi:RND family efflux transporter MFP subunit
MQFTFQQYHFVMKSSLALAFVIMLLISCSGKKSETTGSTRSSSIPVQVAQISSVNNSNTVVASGLISTEDEIRLSFKIGGVIERMLVEESQQVRKGQLLAALNTTEINAQTKQVELGLAKAQRDYERASNLYKDSVITLEQFQNSKTGLEIAQQNLQQVQFNNKYASIYAPSDGFIIKKLVNAGGTPALVMGALGNSSKWVLRAGLADREWALVEKGDKAIVTSDAFPDKSFTAVITKKALAADMISGSFEIELTMEVKGLKPAVGMFGKAAINPSKITKGFSIPYEALLEANGQKGFVFVTNDQKTVKRVEVNIASIDNNRVVISDGLGDYAFVIISGSPYLKDGASITITK